MREQKQDQQTVIGNKRLEYKSQIFGTVTILSIHDPVAVKSSCAISINAGSVNEPDQMPGLAHLLQHMLFMGSSSYPTPNSYATFLSQHSGYENAETTDFFTNYYCQIPTQYFEEVIRRTCDALAHPLLPDSSINAEIQAVHEESVLAGNDDESRMEEIVKIFMNPPLNRFAMGNKASLDQPNIRAALVEFYEKYYRNSAINVVLYSSMSINEMQDCLFNYFAQMSQQMQTPTPMQHPIQQTYFKYEALNLPKQNSLASLKSINNQDTLTIHIPINLTHNTQISSTYISLLGPEKLAFLRSLTQFTHQFYTCLSYILSHPSNSSLDNFLEEEEISTGVTLQLMPLVPFTQFMLVIGVGLEEEWVERKVEVLEKVMGYLREFLTPVNMEGVMKQVTYLANLAYINYEVDDMEEYVCGLARDMYEVGLPQAISFKSLGVDRIKNSSQWVKWCIEQIFGNRKIVVFSSPQQLKGNVKKQPYLGIQYKMDKFNSASHPQSKLSFPNSSLPPNPFLPLSQTLHPPSNTPYTPIRLSTNIHFSHSFSQVIKGGLKLLIHHSESYAFLKLFVQFMDLYVEEVEDFTFAEHVGLDYYFEYQQGMLFMYMFGYDELVAKMLAAIGDRLGHFVKGVREGTLKNDEEVRDIFEEAMENLQEDIDNYYEGEMDDLTDKIRDQLLLQDSLPLHMISKEVQKIKKNKFLERAAQLFTNSNLEWIVVGNFQAGAIEKLIKQFQANIGNDAASKNKDKQGNRSVKQNKVLKLSSMGSQNKIIKLQIRLQFQQIQTSTCLSYFQVGPYSQQLFWILQILYLYLDQPFYTHIRMQRKLSYDLEVNIVNTRGILGICFLLVSSKIDPEEISKEIHLFLSQYANAHTIYKGLQGQFEKIKENLVLKYSQKFGTVEDCFDFICDEIQNRTLYFQKKDLQQVRQKLSKITIEQVTQITTRIFTGTCLQILLVSKAHKNAYSSHRPKINSIESIKNKGQYYRDFLADLDFSFIKMGMSE